MKRILIYSALALILASCGSGKQDKNSGASFTKVVGTDIENIDSLANLVPATWKNMKTIVEGVAHSGKYASKVDSVNNFSLLYEQKLSNIDKQVPKEINFSAFVYALQANPQVRLVVSVNDNPYYQGVILDKEMTTVNEWKEIKGNFKLPDDLTSDNVIRAYVYNNKNGEFLVDDLNLEFVY